MESLPITARMSLTRRSFLVKAAAASVIGPAIVASSGPSGLFSTAYAESEDSSGSRDYLKLMPRSARRKVETAHTLAARIYPSIADVAVEFLVIFGPNAGTIGSEPTDEDGVASFTYTGGPDEGSDFILAWIDDGDAEFESHEPYALGLVHWQLTHPIDKLLVSPRSGESLLNTEHTIMATVIPPAAGVPIIFSIITGPNADLTRTVLTGEDGTASFSYIGTVEGKDTVAVLADANASGDADEDERLVIVRRNWVIELSEDESDEASSNDESSDHESSDESKSHENKVHEDKSHEESSDDSESHE